jgi:predicted DNA-binding protein (MmcQ/YjbR family)
VDLKELRRYCLDHPGATEDHPFGPGALVMKVGNKMFAIVMEDEDPLSISLKCEPDIAVMLRESFEDVGPGYHLNKRHWNTVTLTDRISDKQAQEWIDDSYDLVVDSLPRKVRDGLT